MSVSWLILFEAVFVSRCHLLNFCCYVCVCFKGVAIMSVCFGVIMFRGVKV